MPELPPKARRLAALDGLRGLLATFVLVHHVCVLLGSNALFYPSQGAVWMFFTMSAHVLTRAWDGRYGLFIVRRLVRLWPVYVTCWFTSCLVIGRGFRWGDMVWFPLLDLPFAQAGYLPDPPAWSLFVEVWAMPFMPLFVRFGRSGWQLRVAILAAWLVAWWLERRFFYGIFFLLGAALSSYTPRVRLLEMAVPQWLGRVSYSLYLSHWPLLLYVRDHAGSRYVPLCVPLTFLLAWLVWFGVETPSIAWSRRIAAGGRKRAVVF